MPHIRHHRRHHSWPHCGSGLCMREPRSLELRIARPEAGLNLSQWSFQQATVLAEELPDDTEMAGIIRSRPPRVHRLWSRPLLKDKHEEIHLSATAVEARKHVHRSALRRLIRRAPLDRTRSLFAMPATRKVGDRTVISGWMPSRSSAPPLAIIERNRTALPGVDAARFVAERRHRRCHSEQPRAWREPGASLWTLQEES